VIFNFAPLAFPQSRIARDRGLAPNGHGPRRCVYVSEYRGRI